MRSRISKLEGRFPTISKRTGITVDRLQSLATGSNPTLNELLSLSSYLRIPVDALADFDDNVGRSDMRLRATSQPDLFYAAETRVRLITQFILSCVSNLKSISVELKAKTDNFRSIDDASLVVRSLFNFNHGVDPVTDIVAAISGAKLAHIITLRNFGVDGASVCLNGVNFIFVSAQYLPRMRFTIAHELAHIVFGHCRDNFILDEVVDSSNASDREDERLANTFASCLLIPALGATRFLANFKRVFEQSNDSISSVEIAYMSRFFGVSFEVAGNRLEQLRIIDRGVTVTLLREMRKQFPSAEAYMRSLPPGPNYSNIPVISPELKKDLRDNIETGDVSVSRVANIFGYSVNETYEFIR